ncbi:hypothetical protein LCGC14_2429260, partial [marine sediment metagenome]
MKAVAGGGSCRTDTAHKSCQTKPKREGLNMKWLLDRIRRQKHQHRETDEERAATEAASPDSTQPRLMLLVHDASAPASYQLQTFEDASTAEEFVQFWYPPTTEHGVLAFWAMHRKPVRWPGSSEERPAEVVILIRDEARREIVYPYSLPNMEAARSWVMKEAATGLDLRLVLMYWAVPAKIGRNRWGHVRITPAAPPSARRPELLRSSTVIVSKGGPDIVRLRSREFPWRSYVITQYHNHHIDSAYGTSPLMVGSPVHKAATEALALMLQAAALRTGPPVRYDPSDYHLEATGG